MTPIPENVRDLLEKPIVVTLVTLMPDGAPQATPIWCSYDGEHIWVNTAVGRQKDKNLQAQPQVTIGVIDPQNPYHWVEVRGRVVERTLEGAVDHINDLSQQYVGKPYFDGFRSADEIAKQERVIFKIAPQKVNGG